MYNFLLHIYFLVDLKTSSKTQYKPNILLKCFVYLVLFSSNSHIQLLQNNLLNDSIYKMYSAFTKYLGTIEELKQKPVDQIPPEESIIIPAPKTNIISPGKRLHHFTIRFWLFIYIPNDVHTRHHLIQLPLFLNNSFHNFALFLDFLISI